MVNFLSKAYDRTVLGCPIYTLVVLLLVLSFFSYYVKDFKLDASADTLILENDKDLKILREITERYGIKDFLVVTFTPDKDLFSKESLKRLGELRDELRKLERVYSVTTILDVPLLKASDVKLSEITKDSVKTVEDTSVDIIRAKREMLESPIYKDLILSPDGQTTALQVNLETDVYFLELFKKRNRLLNKRIAGTLSKEEKTQLEEYTAEYEVLYASLNKKRHQDIKKIRSIINSFKKYGVLYLGGVPMISDDTIAFVRNDLVVFGFGVFIFIVATLTIIFREVRWVVLPLLSCFFAVLIMVGVLGFLNWKVTVLSSNFISLMLIITLSMNIHLAVRYRQLCRDMPSASQFDLVSTTARKMVWPCL
ncbi:MAG: hypothetical protein AMJ42_05380, partial [Deltaproteobacteria bacterium DG_8]